MAGWLSSNQTGGLGRKHRQYLALEAGIAKRHSPKMGDIDWTVIGGKWRRWHPIDPIQMKGHVDNPKFFPPARSDGKVSPPNHGKG